ncbi:MAG TPA: alpha/beta hydrolase [Verrucomicrobiae bacterium]
MEFPIWPPGKIEKAGAVEKVQNRSKDPAKPDRVVLSVAEPTLTVYLAGNSNSPSPAIIICPGGGYGRLAIDKEGHDIARWLNQIGVAGLVLKYRLPNYEETGRKTPLPMLDAARAIRLTRAKAGEWNIDPAKLGIMGFSAGGHLASTLATHFDTGKAKARDNVEQFSSRPNFVVLVYPLITMKDPYRHAASREMLLGETPEEAMIAEYSNEDHVTAATPPAFIVHAADDRTARPTNSFQFKAAYERAGVPCVLHMFEKGGHGFGLGVYGGAVTNWPGLCEEWLRKMKYLPASRKP